MSSKNQVMITGQQLRASRLFLGLTIEQLAEDIGVGTSTIKRSEAMSQLRNNLHGKAIMAHLKSKGISFLKAGDTAPAPAVTLPG